MKKTLFEGNGLTLVEKETKKGLYLILKYEYGIDYIELDIRSSSEIIVLINGIQGGIFGYTDTEVMEKGLNFENHKVKKTKKKLEFFIPKNKSSKVTRKDIVKAMDGILDYYDGEEFSTVAKPAFEKLEKVYLKLIKE